MHWSQWKSLSQVSAKSFICGYCGVNVGSSHAYCHQGVSAQIIICTNCGYPTFFYSGEQHPGPLMGRNVNKLPPDISDVYKEIRDSVKSGCYTGAILLGRKLIMHLAVDIAGAKEGEKFVQYVDHLNLSGYIPPNGKRWLTEIKDLGNEKNHELKLGNQSSSEKILKFIEILLIFMYEFADDKEQ